MKRIISRKDPRVIDLLIAYGPAGYGTYAILVEYLRERKSLCSPDDIKRIAYELHADAEILRSVIEDFNLFIIVDNKISHNNGKTEQQTTPAPSTETEKRHHPLKDDAVKESVFKSQLPEKSDFDIRVRCKTTFPDELRRLTAVPPA